MTNPADRPDLSVQPPAAPVPPPVPSDPVGPGALPSPAQSSPAEPTPAQPAPSRPAPGFDDKGKVGRTRVSGLWIGLIATALFIVLLIIFIAQNSHQTTIHLFGWHGRFSIALTILLSAVIGMLLVAIPGTVRILQLRRALRKNVPSGRTR
jgi:uncharacterized integral membrane protein